MLARIVCFFACILMCFSSCQKRISSPGPDVNQGSSTEVKNTTYALEACHCSEDSTEFIKGIFNGVPMCFNTPAAFSDSFGNAYYYKAGYQDQLNMIRENSGTSMMCSFYFMSTDVLHKSLPYIMPHPDLAYCEHIELALLNQRQPWASQCQGCDTDDADYWAETGQQFSVTVTDTTGGYLRGTFSGSATTKTGRLIQIKDGSFNIHIYKVPMDKSGN